MLKQLIMIGVGLLLVTLPVSVALAKVPIIIYYTPESKIPNLQHINQNALAITVVVLGKLEQLEAELTRQAKLTPGISEVEAGRRIRKHLHARTVNAIGEAWKVRLQAEQHGVDPKRLPAVFFRGEIYHDVRDIRRFLRPAP